MATEFFFEQLPDIAKSRTDRAALILSYTKLFSDKPCLSVKEIADYFEQAHLARPNVTVLANKLTADRRISIRKGTAKALRAADDYLRDACPEIFLKTADQTKPVSIDNALLASAPFIDQTYLDDLQNTLQFYGALHVLENSMRRLIAAVLAAKLGDDWWSVAASAAMKRKHEDRLAKERTRAWLPARSELGPLYSIDWSDLITLMRKYEDAFVPFVGEIDFLHRFSDLGLLRHVVAHHGFIDDHADRDRVALALRDWNLQIGPALKRAGVTEQS